MRKSGARMFPSGTSPAAIEGGIHHDTTEPRQRRRVAAERMTRTKRAKKGVLYHVFRVLADVARSDSAQLSPGLFVQMYRSEERRVGTDGRCRSVRSERD